MSDEAARDVVTELRSALADRYRIEREIGMGGMATVLLAHDLRHDRDVAIKVLHPELGAALGSNRFLTEIRTTAKLQHPHILPLIDSGEAGGLLYYVMPYVTGETLRTRIEREHQLPVDAAVRIANEVADALGHAHSLGIIHRDIKPENILLQGGHALVADFGIALAVQSAGGQRMTQTGLSLGTPQYMSPEQAMGERTVDARSDIYALGAVTYEMLTGEPPFTGPTVQAIVARLISEDPRAITAQRKAVPEYVENAVFRSLEKLPADRFATAAEFAAALNDAATGTTAARANRRQTRQTGAAAIRPSRVMIVWGLALIAAGAFGGWMAARLSQPGAVTADALTVTSILAPEGGSFGEQRSLALSPDGRRLAFVFAAADGSRMLWLRRLDRLEAEPVPRTRGATAPFWSPDGRSLGYFADGYLTILDDNGETRRVCLVSNPTGGSWSSSGLIAFGSDAGISTVPEAGDPDCRLIVRRGSAPQLKGQFLPDGKRILFSRGRGLDMAVADLDGKLVSTLPLRAAEFAFASPGYLVFASRTDARAVDAQRFDVRKLALEGPVVRIATSVRSSGGVHTFAVASSGGFAFLPGSVDRPYLEYDAGGVLRDTIRVDGTWTLGVRPRGAGPPFVAVAGTSVGVWLYDMDSDRATRLLMRDSVAAGGVGFGAFWPVFSSDGSRILYTLTSATECRIMERNLATEVERVVQKTASAAFFLLCPASIDWSYDGRYVLVRRDSSLRIEPVDGAGQSREIVRPGRIWEGRFSPDGRSIAYSSDETGRAEVYIQSLSAGTPLRVSVDGGRWPAWSHRGSRLSFLTPNGRVQQVEIGSGAAGTPRTLFSVPTWRRSMFDDRGTGFAVVGDGERYIMRQSPSGVAVAFMSDWTSLLRRAESGSAAAIRE